MATILCIGEDIELLQSRAAVLRETGGHVQWALSRNALAILESQRFDLLILCHSVKQERAAQFYQAARRQVPTTPILRLNRASGGVDENVDSDMVSNPDPMSLVRSTAALLSKQTGPQKR